MRWHIKKSPIDITEWHDWYAWRPVWLDEERTWVWLERIERKLYRREPMPMSLSLYNALYQTKGQ
jgi:hypothetical protein